MDSKPYPKEKREIILEKSDAEILGFLNQIPLGALKNYARTLPKVPGFSGRPTELNMKLNALIRRMRGPVGSTDTEKGWDKFGSFFVLWVNSQHELNKILNNFSNEEDFNQDRSLKVPPNSAKDIECFSIIIDSENRSISREIVRTFYEFGYFIPDSRIEEKIETMKSEADLAQKDLLSQLPEAIASIEKKITVLEESSSSFNKVIENEIDQHEMRLNSSEDKLDSLGTRVDQIVEQSGTSLKSLSLVQAEVRSIKANIREFEVGTSNLTKKLDALLKMNFTKSDDVVSNKTEIESIKSELSSLKANIEDLFSRIGTGISGNIAELQNRLQMLEGTSCSIVLENQGLKVKDCKTSFRSIDDAVNILSESLYSAGLNGDSSILLARDIFSSILAGQLITFSGSMAQALESATIAAIAHNRSIRIKIPPGYVGLNVIDEVIKKGFHEFGNAPAVVIEGINVSTFETYGGELRKHLLAQIHNSKARDFTFFAFATLIDGPASLPLSSAITELGPVFDSDAFNWRTRDFEKTKFFGQIQADTLVEFRSLLGEDPISAPFSETFKSLLKIPDSALWSITLVRALRWLQKIGLSDKLPTPLGSLSFGWLLPHAVASGKHPQDIGEALREAGLSAEEQRDQRISWLIESELRRITQ